MTVAELIGVLQRLDPSLPVAVAGVGLDEGTMTLLASVEAKLRVKDCGLYCDPENFEGQPTEMVCLLTSYPVES